jgi:hypothetical protein
MGLTQRRADRQVLQQHLQAILDLHQQRTLSDSETSSLSSETDSGSKSEKTRTTQRPAAVVAEVVTSREGR